MPISETIRRQPRSSTAIESAERISYLGIVLTNIDFHRAFERMGRNLTDLKPRPYDSHSRTRSHKVEHGGNEQPERHPGGRPGGPLALGGRALVGPDDVHRA